MLEEDVHRFPKRVVEDFDQLLMNERIFDGGLQGVGAARPGKSECHGSAFLSRFEDGPNFEIAFGRTEAHHDVFGTKNGIEPGAKHRGQIEGGQRALANDDGMNEFDGDVLRIC